MCVYIPYRGAVNLERTNSVWYSQAVTEEHERDESAVDGALTHVHVYQQGSLSYKTEADLDEQNS